MDSQTFRYRTLHHKPFFQSVRELSESYGAALQEILAATSIRSRVWTALTGVDSQDGPGFRISNLFGGGAKWHATGGTGI